MTEIYLRDKIDERMVSKLPVLCLCSRVQNVQLSTDLVHQFCFVSWLVSLLLLAIVVFCLWTWLGFVVDAAGFVPETFTALNQLLTNDIAVSAFARKLSLDLLLVGAR